MKNDFVYLTIHQGFALTSEIEELKKNPYFRDALAEDFLKEVSEQAINITVNSLDIRTNLLQKFNKNGNKIKISKSKFEYVTRLTGIDVFNEQFMNKHISELNEVEPILGESKPKSK